MKEAVNVLVWRYRTEGGFPTCRASDDPGDTCLFLRLNARSDTYSCKINGQILGQDPFSRNRILPSVWCPLWADEVSSQEGTP